MTTGLHGGTAPLAAITTIFTPPCPSTYLITTSKALSQYPPFPTEGPTTCVPPAWNANLNGEGFQYYSPAICPQGFAVGENCGLTVTRTAQGFPAVAPTETVAYCVPTSMTCTTDTSDFRGGVWGFIRSVSATGFQFTVGPAMQIRWAESDLTNLATHPLTPGLKVTAINTNQDTQSTPTAAQTTPTAAPATTQSRKGVDGDPGPTSIASTLIVATTVGFTTVPLADSSSSATDAGVSSLAPLSGQDASTTLVDDPGATVAATATGTGISNAGGGSSPASTSGTSAAPQGNGNSTGSTSSSTRTNIGIMITLSLLLLVTLSVLSVMFLRKRKTGRLELPPLPALVRKRVQRGRVVTYASSARSYARRSRSPDTELGVPPRYQEIDAAELGPGAPRGTEGNPAELDGTEVEQSTMAGWMARLLGRGNSPTLGRAATPERASYGGRSGRASSSVYDDDESDTVPVLSDKAPMGWGGRGGSAEDYGEKLPIRPSSAHTRMSVKSLPVPGRRAQRSRKGRVEKPLPEVPKLSDFWGRMSPVAMWRPTRPGAGSAGAGASAVADRTSRAGSRVSTQIGSARASKQPSLGSSPLAKKAEECPGEKS